MAVNVKFAIIKHVVFGVHEQLEEYFYTGFM